MENVGLFTYPKKCSLSLPRALLNRISVFAIQQHAEQHNKINEIENWNGIGAHIYV